MIRFSILSTLYVIKKQPTGSKKDQLVLWMPELVLYGIRLLAQALLEKVLDQ